jgi:hypothetical protein
LRATKRRERAEKELERPRGDSADIGRPVNPPAVKLLLGEPLPEALRVADRVAVAEAQLLLRPEALTEEFLTWSDKWMAECLRILRENGTMFVIGPSEQLAHLMVRLPADVNRRWLVWHFTNKLVRRSTQGLFEGMDEMSNEKKPKKDMSE